MSEFVKNESYKELRPANVFDVAANETWLEDMARQGWRLTGFSSREGVFEQTEPFACRYRMSPLPKKETAPAPEVIEAYRDMGWEYAATIRGVFHVWRCCDPSAPELDTDPVVQGLGYGYLKRRMTWDCGKSLLLAVGLAALFLILPPSETPLLDLVENAAPGGCLLRLVAGALLLVEIIWQWSSARRMFRTLKAGIPLNRPRPYRRQKWLARALWMSLLLLLVLLFTEDLHAIDGGSLRRGWDAGDRMGTPKPDVVYVDLRELEGAEDTEFWGCRTKIQELCPRMYETRHLSLGPWQGLSRDVEAEMVTTYYRLLTSGLARELAKELVQARPGYMRVSPHGAMEPVPSGELDEFWWIQEDWETQYAVARLGRNVLYLEYEGPTDLRTAGAYLAEVLEK